MNKPTGWIGYTLGGRYKIETLLGQGGMSAVYRAIDPNLRRAVAVKLIHPHLSSDPEFVRRFEEEAAAVAQLRHPNIIQVYDFNHDGDIYYMVLEYLPGETLQSRLKALSIAGQRLPLAETLRIMTTVCEAVAYAHERSMIHRDLKPANMMLSLQGQPILMDFGLAKIMGGQSHTASGAVMGTALYMSPEQVRGEHVDHRADLYALGVILFEMTAGKPPFEADSAMTLMLKHLNEPVPDIRLLAGQVPDQLKTVIDTALAKQRAQPFESAQAMAAALRQIHIQPGVPTRAGPLEMEPSQTSELTSPDITGVMLGQAEPVLAEPVLAQPAPAEPLPTLVEAEAVDIAEPVASAPALNAKVEDVATQILPSEPERTPARADGGEPGSTVSVVESRVPASVAEVPTRPAPSSLPPMPMIADKAEVEQPTPSIVREKPRVVETVPPISPPIVKPQPRRRPAMLWVGLLGLVGVALVAILGVVIFAVLPQFTLPSGAGMAQIPGGTYTVGLDTGSINNAPEQSVVLTTFWLDQHEVTNAEYALFIAETGRQPPQDLVSGTIPSGQEEFPVKGITWGLASEYCRWVKKRLPIEAEWEVAARGSEHWLYPWGNDASRREDLPRDTTYRVGAIEVNRSPFGVYDMAGNVWEWVDSPYVQVGDGEQVIRGGSYDFQVDMAYRLSGPPDGKTMIDKTGFRCAASQVR